jgi:hypothetical protein
VFSLSADGGNRTRLSSLGSWYSTDELHLHTDILYAFFVILASHYLINFDNHYRSCRFNAGDSKSLFNQFRQRAFSQGKETFFSQLFFLKKRTMHWYHNQYTVLFPSTGEIPIDFISDFHIKENIYCDYLITLR